MQAAKGSCAKWTTPVVPRTPSPSTQNPGLTQVLRSVAETAIRKTRRRPPRNMKNPNPSLLSQSSSPAPFASRRNYRRAFFALSVSAALAIGLASRTYANEIIVPSDSFATIQDAVYAAAPGDTIKVLPGTYSEEV